MNWFIGICILAIVSFTGFTYFSSQNLEKPKYKVLSQDGDYQIRLYQKTLWVEVQVSNTDYKSMSREGFRPLANYIFGGNVEKKSMSMTASVSIVEDSSSPSMRFYMPSDRNVDNLPKPNKKEILFVQLPERKLATYSFGGILDQKKKIDALKKLRTWCHKNKIQIKSPAEVFGNNAPYEVIRNNEVAFPIGD